MLRMLVKYLIIDFLLFIPFPLYYKHIGMERYTNVGIYVLL